MSFQSILKELVETGNNGLASAIMGFDGLPVAKHVVQGAECDVETIGVEYGKVLDEIKNASAILKLGEVEEVVVRTLGVDVLMRVINSEYFLAFAIGQKANAGKARFLLRKAVSRARDELQA